MNKIKINYCCQKISTKKNPGGNFGNDFLEKGIGAYPKNIKTSSLRDGVFL